MEQDFDCFPFPSWESLCHFRTSPELTEAQRQEVENLRLENPGWFFQVAKMGLSLSGAGYTSKKFLGCEWADIVDIIHDQAIRNKEMKSTEGRHDCQESTRSYVNREHNQLPCTRATVSRRVKEAARFCGLRDPVLVLGDDDMLGVELVRAGFQDVTSVDIDVQICQQLRAESAALPGVLKILCHDIRLVPPPSFIRPYRMIFLDPMYSLDGIRMFSKAALEFSRCRRDTLLFMSLHLLSLLRPGFGQLPEILRNYDLRLLRFYGGFNAYPIPTGLGRWIKLFNRRFMRTNLMSSQGYMFRFFLSDAILLRKATARQVAGYETKRNQFSDE